MSDILVPSGGDDSGQIQAAIEQAVYGDGVVRLGRGVFQIARTISIKKAVGVRIEGVGGCNPQNCGPGWSDIKRAVGTCLKWAGHHGGVLLEILASPDISLSRMELNGGGTAGVLVQIETLYGWPSTATQINNATFRAAEVGIQLGYPAHPHGVNNDECTFAQIKLSCGVGIRVCNDQSVCHRVSHVDSSCPIGIEILQGGSMVVDRFIQSGAGTDRVGIAFRGGGPNAATLSISNAKLEAGRLLECGGANQVIHVSSYCGNAGSTVQPWRIGPSALVTAQACSFSGPVAELGGLPGRNAVLIIQNSLLAMPAGQSIIYKNVHAYAAVEGVFLQWSNAHA
ncbi:MAG: hypothetical protein ACYCUV_08100 [Phycisphaerae bacterium]